MTPMIWLRITLALLGAVGGRALAQPVASRPTAPDAGIVEALRALKPLPKVHYSWPLPKELLSNPNDPRLFEYVRITHAASVSNDRTSDREFESAVLACKYVNATHPDIPATLAVVCSPWHRRFPKDAPPTDTGPAHQAELDWMGRHLKMMAQWAERANGRYGAGAQISAVLMDTERFMVKPGDAEWNRAITRKLRDAYAVAEGEFPSARIEWFARGMVYTGYGWQPAAQFPGDEPGKFFSSILYCVPNRDLMSETQRRTVAYAIAKNIGEVTPWIALASGYRKDAKGKEHFDYDWDFDVADSEKLGSLVNRPYRQDSSDPWSYVKVAAFFPEPFSPGTPAWSKHFVAYVRGAAGVSDAKPGSRGAPIGSRPQAQAAPGEASGARIE